MNISDYLDKAHVLLDLQGEDKAAALDEMLACLSGAAEIADIDRYVADVWAREKLGSTGIGDGLAFPHARSDAVDRLVMVFGRSKKGIEFDSVDGKPVHLIFLMAAPNADLSNYLKVLARVSLLLRRQDVRNALMNAEKAEEVLEILSQPVT